MGATIDRNYIFRTILAPLFLMIQGPATVTLAWIIVMYFNGSVVQFVTEFDLENVVRLWPRPSLVAARLLVGFFALEYMLLRFLPGEEFKGSPSPSGYTPKYKLNGVPAYVVTHLVLYIAAYRLKLFSPEIIFDNFGPMITTMNIIALGLCVCLYFKGRFFSEHPEDLDLHGPLFDFYEGVELYPTFLGVPFKQLVNCRIGMMGWSVLICAFAAKQYAVNGYVANSMIVSNLIQVVYIIKFYWWEGGYFRSIDIMHDRFGFMICWGCLSWVTSIYTLVSFFLVTHPIQYSMPVAVAILLIGLASIYINYEADWQRQHTRETNGNTTIWGKKPKTIIAQYKNAKGETHQSLLLVSGWWGVARHFQYVPELTLSLMWTVPAGIDHALPYFYVMFLTILLVDRSGRDEVRCRTKYGSYWRKYCEEVPHRIIPYLF